jgi:hypothetical protein
LGPEGEPELRKKILGNDEDFRLIFPSLLLAWRELAGEKIRPPDEPIGKVIRILAKYVAEDLLRKQKRFSPGLLKDLNQAREEAEDIFLALKKEGFSGRKGKSRENYQTAALNRFDDSQKGYQSIKREYLKNKTIYVMRGGHEKGDFIGALLQKIVWEKYGKFIGKQTLLNWAAQEKGE